MLCENSRPGLDAELMCSSLEQAIEAVFNCGPVSGGAPSRGSAHEAQESERGRSSSAAETKRGVKAFMNESVALHSLNKPCRSGIFQQSENLLAAP
jgi:hypothetical protein